MSTHKKHITKLEKFLGKAEEKHSRKPKVKFRQLDNHPGLEHEPCIPALV